jgi:hypothetical protein
VQEGATKECAGNGGMDVCSLRGRYLSAALMGGEHRQPRGAGFHHSPTLAHMPAQQRIGDEGDVSGGGYSPGQLEIVAQPHLGPEADIAADPTIHGRKPGAAFIRSQPSAS